jgi:hypothetical protein
VNYGRILRLLAQRESRGTPKGRVYCGECDMNMDDHRAWCPVWERAQAITARAMREAARVDAAYRYAVDYAGR